MPTPIKSKPSCIHCGTGCDRRPSGQPVVYCSVKCQKDFEYERYIQRWLAREEDGLRGGIATSKHVHHWIRESYGEACMDCGWSKRHAVTGKVPLHLDHIDGNYANCRPENLRLLCPNCHSLTPNFGSLNRGKGRPWTVRKVPPTPER